MNQEESSKANNGSGSTITELEPINRPMNQSGGLVLFSNNYETAISQMEKLVNLISAKCTGERFISNIKDKKYPKVEWWTTVGAMLGLFPVVIYSKRIEGEPDEIKYEARVEVRHNGITITAGESICSSKEHNWEDRDEYAIKSMAITRATGKAYRTGMSFLAVMAGLEGTPAEEIPQVEKPEFSRDYKIGFGKHKGEKLSDIPDDYLDWLSKNAKDKWLKDFATEELRLRDIERTEAEINQTGKKPLSDLYKEKDDSWLKDLDNDNQAPEIDPDPESKPEVKETTKNYSFLKTMAELKKEVGKEIYYRVLSENGYEHANEITNREHQVLVWRVLTTIVNKKRK